MKTLVTVLFVFLFVTGATLLGVLYTQHVQELKKRDAHYAITHLIHTGEVEGAHLAEWMGLEIGANLYVFNVLEAEKRLKLHPCLEQVSVEKASPDALRVRYRLRRPIALVGMLTNTGIDSKGVTFPLAPLYEEQNLPRIYYEGDPALALKILAHQDIAFASIDILDCQAPSLGQRLIVAVTEEGHTLRLPVHNVEGALERYLKLLAYLDAEPQVIDLRLDHLAFLGKIC